METTIDLTPLVLAILGILGAVIARYLIPYIRAKTTVEQQQNIKMWVKIAVEAAEMIYRETGMGERKFDYVAQFLHSKGFDLNFDEMKAMIESAVNEMKHSL